MMLWRNDFARAMLAVAAACVLAIERAQFVLLFPGDRGRNTIRNRELVAGTQRRSSTMRNWICSALGIVFVVGHAAAHGRLI